ncbi:hypothetical protein BZG36_00118 [Bifiguratus adelaidae]|uniref:Uncharacterized protein n=1 Tax=Bifiguratus adelaidae TaxID=1938954 RepID=A0A261Y8M5_9FUNG|nr:hypothetical protein BZG36_00118 [Bifiguratus adelaidae]
MNAPALTSFVQILRSLPFFARPTYKQLSHKLVSVNLSLITQDARSITEDGFRRFEDSEVENIVGKNRIKKLQLIIQGQDDASASFRAESSNKTAQCHIHMDTMQARKIVVVKQPNGCHSSGFLTVNGILPIDTTMAAVIEYLKARCALLQDGFTSSAKLLTSNFNDIVIAIGDREYDLLNECIAQLTARPTQLTWEAMLEKLKK